MRLTLVILFLSSACDRPSAPADTPRPVSVSPADAPRIRVHVDEAHVYRWFPAGETKARVATSIAKVPAASREAVIVVLDEPAPAGLVYVADLRTAADDGTYPWEVLRSSELDKRLIDARGEPERPAGSAATARPAAAPSSEIVMYSASWCGVCSQARRWLDNKGLSYTEKDVEKTPGARDELMRNAEKAGFPRDKLNGVPIFYVNGRMLGGFDPRAIENLLGS